jgi:glutamate N-acetyltransferase/amino-acid N-acetyltransferase
VEADVRQSKQCAGFRAAGVAAGIKKNAAPDLGLIVSDGAATVAAVFTRNCVQAAPVTISRQRATSGVGQAVIVNSGNANCCTGEQGMRDAVAMADAAANAVGIDPERVLVASTGVIGEPLPLAKIQKALPALSDALRQDGFEDFAEAIMTTDTVPKLVRRQGDIEGHPFTVLAAAKGAGMIRPDMATMLCFVCTDVGIDAGLLQQCLHRAVDRTLNRISIDGDTSTNDTVLVLANGCSGAQVATPSQLEAFQVLLCDLLGDIAHRLVKDGEGVTKVVDLTVAGAASDTEAFQIADAVAHSPLVKTAFFGQDANWGRVIAAAGRAGVPLDPDRIDLYFNDVQMVRNGRGCGPRAEALATTVLQRPEFAVTIKLNQGDGRATLLTCDFSVEYVKINADYRS